jgi:hypothetical protein
MKLCRTSTRWMVLSDGTVPGQPWRPSSKASRRPRAAQPAARAPARPRDSRPVPRPDYGNDVTAWPPDPSPQGPCLRRAGPPALAPGDEPPAAGALPRAQPRKVASVTQPRRGDRHGNAVVELQQLPYDADDQDHDQPRRAGPGRAASGASPQGPCLRRAGPPALAPGCEPPAAGGSAARTPDALGSQPSVPTTRHAPQAARPRRPCPGRSSSSALHLDTGGASRQGQACATGSRADRL